MIGGHVLLLVRLRHPSRTNGKVTAAWLQQLPSFSRACARPLEQAPNDADVLNEHTRVRLEGDAVIIDAGSVEWLGPHTLHHSWHEAARLPALAPDADIELHRRRLLAREDLFVVCIRCVRRELLGHTHDRKCHPCMEGEGTVF